jgi:hypothetical protein
MSSSSDWTLHRNYSNFQLNWTDLLRCTPLYSFNSSGCALLYFLGTDPTENAVLYFHKCMFIGPLPSNGCPSIVESESSGICLLSRCLAMGICVTIFITVSFTIKEYNFKFTHIKSHAIIQTLFLNRANVTLQKHRIVNIIDTSDISWDR